MSRATRRHQIARQRESIPDIRFRPRLLGVSFGLLEGRIRHRFGSRFESLDLAADFERRLLAERELQAVHVARQRSG